MPRTGPVLFLLLLTSLLLVRLPGGPARARESGGGAGTELARALASAVDLPTPAARKAAAEALARRADASLPALLGAMRSFGRFQPVEPGGQSDHVRLFVGKGQREVEIDVYVPTGYDPATPAPLMLGLHGAGGAGIHEISRWQGIAEGLGMLVIAPTDSGENVGYRFTRSERDEAWAVLRWARRRFNVDENRIFVSGVSRGGHLAWDLALRHPDVFAAISPAIGGPRLNPAKGQNNLRYLENVAHVPIRDLQGSKDDPRMLFNLRLAFEKLAKLGAEDARLIEFEHLGHSFEMTGVDWESFFATRRDPLRPRVVRRAARTDERRSHWAEITKTDRTVSETVELRVDPAKWRAMADAQRRRTMAKAAEDRTARLVVRRTAPGRFEAESRGVTHFRLLLAEGMFVPDEAAEVLWNRRSGSRTVKRKVRPDIDVLLQDFVERFDRTFLPIAQLRVP